jgi:hypothetical protein
VTGPSFAHASEEELARILDYYQVRWEYEPRRFPILWNLEGKVVESFSPDFYLPDLDLFLELTTLKQSLVRRKNRKLRRLRELYPDIRIKLLYGKDFKALMLKYGRIDLVASLTGPEGQARLSRDGSLALAGGLRDGGHADEDGASATAAVSSSAVDSSAMEPAPKRRRRAAAGVRRARRAVATGRAS